MRASEDSDVPASEQSVKSPRHLEEHEEAAEAALEI